jgi:26S proteasome regulatory subunit N9
MKESKVSLRVQTRSLLYIYVANIHAIRLWHQLTTQILEFFKKPESSPYQISLFQNFVAELEDKINKLSLVSIALQAAGQFSGKESSNEFKERES